MKKLIILFFLFPVFDIAPHQIREENKLIIFGSSIQQYSQYLFGYPVEYDVSKDHHPNWGGLVKSWSNENAWDIFVEPHTPVYSIIDGVVLSTRFRENRKTVWGHNIIIENKHEKVFMTHLDEVVLCPGDTVKQGQLIGYIGEWPEYYRIGKEHMPSHLHIALYNMKLENHLDYDLKIQPAVNPRSLKALIGV